MAKPFVKPKIGKWLATSPTAIEKAAKKKATPGPEESFAMSQLLRERFETNAPVSHSCVRVDQKCAPNARAPTASRGRGS